MKTSTAAPDPRDLSTVSYHYPPTVPNICGAWHLDKMMISLVPHSNDLVYMLGAAELKPLARNLSDGGSKRRCQRWAGWRPGLSALHNIIKRESKRARGKGTQVLEKKQKPLLFSLFESSRPNSQVILSLIHMQLCTVDKESFRAAPP
ncbi:hypothetical protein EYR41_005412 [Orbilia oligospora]|uniref:Uncharacterized protein n=1 Tax=Orbilia oligospora TaxID=2813651 RepID=A0A8H2HUD8_ORBOL|nr:hypothetical protein EYR41_005412 [Orbilia oligospora]